MEKGKRDVGTDKSGMLLQEYRNQKNLLSALLRDKKTNKRIVLVGKNLDKNHLLRFLSQAKLNQDILLQYMNKTEKTKSLFVAI